MLLPDIEEDDRPLGEVVAIDARVVVSPVDGRFNPLPPEVFTTEGEWVREGQRVATIATIDGSVDVTSPFTGWMMGMLSYPGQPVRANEGLFWIR